MISNLWIAISLLISFFSFSSIHSTKPTSAQKTVPPAAIVSVIEEKNLEQDKQEAVIIAKEEQETQQVQETQKWNNEATLVTAGAPSTAEANQGIAEIEKKNEQPKSLDPSSVVPPVSPKIAAATTSTSPRTISQKKELPKTDTRYFWEISKTIKLVQVKRDRFDYWQDLKPGNRIYEGDILKTGEASSVLLLIHGLNNQESYTQLFENTELKVIKLSKDNLDHLSDVYLDLILGEVFVNVEKLPQTSTFKIKTPTAVAGVRGTLFNVQVLINNVFRILVLRGVVGVTQEVIQGAISELHLKAGEFLEQDPNIPTQPQSIDEETIQAYQAKTEQITQIILEHLQNPPPPQEYSDTQNENSQDTAPPPEEGYPDQQPADNNNQESDDLGDPNDPGGPSGPGSDDGNAGESVGDDFTPIEGPGYPRSGSNFYSLLNSTGQFFGYDPFDPRSPNFDPGLVEQFFQSTALNPDFLYGEQFITNEVVNDTMLDQFFQDFFDPNNPDGGFVFTGFENTLPPVNPETGLASEIPLQKIDKLIFVDSAQGDDNNFGNDLSPVKTLEKAMNIANAQPSQDFIAILLLFRDNQPEYTVPGDGLILRPRTGIIGKNAGAFGEHAIVNGQGKARVFLANAGPNLLSNLLIKNVDASGVSVNVNVESDHAALTLNNVILQECAVGLLLKGVGTEGAPSFEALPDPLKNTNSFVEGEKGVRVKDSVFRECKQVAVLNPSDSDPSILDIFSVKIENCGTALALRSSGGTNSRIVNTQCINNQPLPGFSPLIDILGSAQVDFLNCQFNNNNMIPAGDSLIAANGSGKLSFSKCMIAENNISTGKSILSVQGFGLHMENCLIVRNNYNSADLTMNSLIVVRNSNAPTPLLNCTISHRDLFNPVSIAIKTDGKNLLKLYNSAVTGFSPAISSESSPNTLVLANNFFFNKDGSSTQFSPIVTTMAGSFNLSDINEINSGFGAAEFPTGGNLQDNPMYSGEASGNYKPAPTSPLINVGANIGFLLRDPGDIFGNPRIVDLIDIGAIEVQAGGDPLVSGRLYDSVTGETIQGGAISIIETATNVALETQEAGEFNFDVLPANYYFAVSKEGYFFPSTRKALATAGDHGSSFTVVDGVNQQIDIPLDAAPYLIIYKTANKKQATPGEVVTFNVSLLNAYWYSSVDNFKLMDTLPLGFKYISGSARQDNAPIADPSSVGRTLSFPIATLARLGSSNVSFQASVSTGVSFGTYGSSAVCQDISNNAISNESALSMEVVPDTLFTNGTLVGRVFMDENNNGRYDDGEPGVKHATLATEYGALITTDEFGLYHLANVQTGRHTVQVDPNTLSPGLVSGNKHGLSFEVFEGSIAKANISIVKESLENPRRDFFLVSLGEIAFRQNKISGNAEMVKGDSSFDESFKVDGRGAFFLRGKIKGKYLTTASYDSERLSHDQRTLRRNRLFTNLDPNKYYPIYGDGSKVNYDATDTQDALYILVEWDESFAKWGNMDVDWPLYRRAMHGGQVLLKSTEKTQFNETKREAEVFVATSDHQSMHEEFIGTGTSLYHLGNTPIVEGSEQVYVEFRNRLGQSAYQRIPLHEEVDYTIDYNAGRITLKRPLTSTILNYSQTIISQDILAGSQAILVVDYEFENLSVFDRQNFGGRVKNTFGDHLSVQGAYAEEDRTLDPYTLASGTTTYQVDENTAFSATYSNSKESFSGGGFSYDSGLTIGSQSADAKVGLEGNAWSLSGNSYLFEKLNLTAAYSEQDSGFSARSSLGASDTKRFEGSALYDMTELWKVGASHLNNQSAATSALDQSLSVVDHLYRTNVFVETDREKWDSRLEYSYQDVGIPYDGTLYLGALPPRGKQLVAARVGYKPWERHYYYLIGQTTLEEDSRANQRNDMGTLGTKLPLFDRVDVQMEGRSGSIGNSALMNLILHEDANAQSHIGYETGTHDDFGKFEKVSFAKTYVTTDGIRYRFLKDYSYYRNRILNGDLMEAEIPLTRNWSLGLSYEISHVDQNKTQGAIQREVSTVRYNFIEPDEAKFFGKFEWREDENVDSGITIKHIYLEDDLTMQVTEDLSWMARGALGYAKEENSSRDAFDFKQAGTGLGLRPKNNDWLNLLARYTYTQDLPLERLNLFLEDGEEKKHVSSLDSIFDLNETLQLVEKVAYRNMQSQVGNRGWQESDTYLWIHGIHLKFLEKCGVGIEYRILENTTFKDKKSGYLAQLSYDLNDMVQITVGYNFTSFDDNLSNRDEYDRSGGFIRLNGKY